MSNFYTEWELPIITVRTKFYPRKTTSSPLRKRLPSYRSEEKASKMVAHCLRDLHLVGLEQREYLKEATVRCEKELSVERGMHGKYGVQSTRRRL